MSVFQVAGIQSVYHYLPLHYLPFIASTGSLLSKPAILARGFSEEHFRSMSHRHDIARGFGSYAFLTTHPAPPILRAKLSAGFPHICIRIPATALEGVPFHLCRFNVAMTRRLRRNGKPGFPESNTNGRYYGNMQIPIAKTGADKAAMLARYAASESMIEVLVPEELPLPETTSVLCFSKQDCAIVDRVVSAHDRKWRPVTIPPPCKYPRSQSYGQSVSVFVNKALADLHWRGDGLEYDRV